MLYYSSYGHIEHMSKAVAKGVVEVQGIKVVIKQVPELVVEEVVMKSNFKIAYEHGQLVASSAKCLAH